MVSNPPSPHARPVGCSGQYLQESCAEARYQSAPQHTLRPPHFLQHSSSPRTCLHRRLQMHLKISLLRLSLGPATLLLSALANDCGPLASPKPLRKGRAFLTKLRMHVPIVQKRITQPHIMAREDSFWAP